MSLVKYSEFVLLETLLSLGNEFFGKIKADGDSTKEGSATTGEPGIIEFAVLRGIFKY